MTTAGQARDAPASATETTPTIRYESYLLRLRRVSGPDGERRQVCLRCISDDEEHYFNSLRELMAYLRQRNGAREQGPSSYATGGG